MARKVNEEQVDTNALIESSQGPAVTGATATKPEKLPIEEQPRRSGDPCPRKDCKGFLGVMSTHKTETHRIRHLSCSSCKLVGGKEVIQL